jgi:N-acetylglucosamine-6-phosphate deacetylase
MRTVLTAAKLWDGQRLLNDPVVTVEDGIVSSISSGEIDKRPSTDGIERHDYPGATLAPSFFDIHIHGAAGHDLMEATPEALNTVGRFLASHGTGSYLATTVTAPVDTTLRALAGLAKLIDHPDKICDAHGDDRPTARPIGIHLEGPFLSHAKCGAQPREHLLAPDIALFDRFFEAAGGHARLMTLAPELPGAVELAAHATSCGVRVSMGHSDATAAETRAVIASGAVSATHTFNAMRALNHQEPGILGVVLTEDALYAEFICDGIHSTREMAKLFWRAKGPEHGILITDAMSATGMPDGEYLLGNFPVQVADGRAMIHGVLAGSVLTLDRGLRNFVEFAGAPLNDALRLLTVNPATMTGLADQVGTLTMGRPANMVAVDGSGKLAASIRDGKLVPSFSAA